MADVANDARGVVYYPSCVVNLVVRMDESLQVREDQQEHDRSEVEKEIGILPGAATLGDANVKSGQTTPRDGNQTTTSSASQNTTRIVVEPLVVPNSDNLNRIMNRVPKHATLDLSGVRQAWQFSLAFDFRDLPVDPRLLRGCGVEIHLGTVPAPVWAKGQENVRNSQTGQILSRINTRSSAVRDGRVVSVPNIDTLVMFGAVDAWSVRHTPQGSLIEMNGRDLRGYLLDLKVPMSDIGKLNLNQPIHAVIKDIVKQIKSHYDMNLDVMIDAVEWESRGGVPRPSELGAVNPSRRSVEGDKTRASPQGGQDDVSYWVLITRYCFLVGAIPYFSGHELWIRPARNIFDLHKDQTYRPPFVNDRQITYSSGEKRSLRVRQLVYGRDISDLSFERKYAGVVTPIVEVVSIDETKRGKARLLSAQWPLEKSKAGNMKAEGDRIRVNVGGIRDVNKLLVMAQDLYEEIGRGEIGGSASTANLASFGGDNADPDIIKMRPTDGIEITVDARALADRTPLVSELNKHSQRTFSEEAFHIAGILDGQQITEGKTAAGKTSTDALNIARAIVATARSLVSEDQRFFNVNNVKFEFSERGIQTSFDFRSYTISRNAANSPGMGENKESKIEKETVRKKSDKRKGGSRGQTPGQTGIKMEKVGSVDFSAGTKAQRIMYNSLIDAGMSPTEAKTASESAAKKSG